MTEANNPLGEAIRRARFRNDLTQAGLGAEVGVSQAQISGWETGRSEPSQEQLAALKQFLGPFRRSPRQSSPGGVHAIATDPVVRPSEAHASQRPEVVGPDGTTEANSRDGAGVAQPLGSADGERAEHSPREAEPPQPADGHLQKPAGTGQSYLNALLARVEEAEPTLARELRKEIKKLSDAQSYGLVFEHHIPETLELPGRRIRRGVKVRAAGSDKQTWLVTGLTVSNHQRIAELVSTRDPEQTRSRRVDELTVIAEFGDPIYPGFKSLGRITRGGDKPCHLVINGENFHSLEALIYAYRGRIDCVYIDPPYNSGEESWVYSDRYVDVNDTFADSLWLSFMNRRLLIAKELLSKDSVLAVHINEHEVNNLGVLLRQIFPSARLNMLTVRVAGAGQSRDGLSRVDEQVFIAFFGNAVPAPIASLVGEKTRRRSIWDSMSGSGMQNQRPQRSPTMVYPVFIDRSTGALVGAGRNLTERLDQAEIKAISNDMAPPATPEAPRHAAVIWATDDNGDLFGWRLRAQTLMEHWSRGYIKVTPARRSAPGHEFTVKYLSSGTIRQVEAGKIALLSGGSASIPTLDLRFEGDSKTVPGTIWATGSHSTTQGGDSLTQLFGIKPFNYPKSPYLAYDLLSVMVGNRPNALVLDYFAGSGTTQHALSMLNAVDGGHRTSILVTNNQVDKKSARALVRSGIHPGSPEFAAAGIFHRTTRPRITYAMSGEREGKPIPGEYLAVGGNDARLIADGFAENVEFLELTYEDPEEVRLDLAFRAVAPLLWMRSGAQGPRIQERSETYAITDRYAVLFNSDRWKGFCDAVRSRPTIRCVFVVTDSEAVYQSVVRALPPSLESFQLYESYLTNFTINRWET